MSFETLPIINRTKTIGSAIRGKFTFGEFDGITYTAKIYFDGPGVVQFGFWSGQKDDFGKSIDMTSGTTYKNAETHYGIANGNIIHETVDAMLLQKMLRMVGQIRLMILSSERDIEFLEPFVERLS
jgi:hypothetical protein